MEEKLREVVKILRELQQRGYVITPPKPAT